MERPQFKAHFQTVTVEGEGLFVLSEREPAVLLRGRLYERLAPLLDGQRSVAELIARLRGQLSAAEVYYTLGQLEHKGYLVEGHAARGGAGVAGRGGALAGARGRLLVGTRAGPGSGIGPSGSDTGRRDRRGRGRGRAAPGGTGPPGRVGGRTGATGGGPERRLPADRSP